MVGYFLKWKEIVFLPDIVHIETNNNCNYRCLYCQVPRWNKETVYLNKIFFNRLLEQIPSLTKVKLQGIGEPLLNKEFIEMLEMGEARRITMSFFTNGSLCNGKIAEQLAQLKNTIITFSVDGATAETFEKIRAGSNFQEVKENIGNFVRLRGEKKQPGISIWFIITKDNLQEIRQIVILAKELGVDSISLQPFLSDWGKSGMKEYIDRVKLDIHSTDTSNQIHKAEELAKEIKIKLNICYDSFMSQEKKCLWPWRSAYIAANGDVVPCCMIADSDIASMGNLSGSNFAQIWYSDKYRDLRRMIKKHDLPDYCKHCYV
jgi:radical SAM protein with 4Fe4S-binding SPASM domain